MKRAIRDMLAEARAAGRPVALVTRLSDGHQALADAEGVAGELALAPETAEAVRAMLADGASGTLDAADGRLFVRVYATPWRLFIVGAVHIAQCMAEMARPLDFALTVIDPRGAFATAERFPDLRLLPEWPDDVLRREGLDSRSAVVTLTHDPKVDDPALETALASPAFYIGALGSSRTHAKRCARLSERGFGPEQLARIHAPVGLDLGGRQPGEIALAVLAELVQARYRGASA